MERVAGEQAKRKRIAANDQCCRHELQIPLESMQPESIMSHEED